MTNPINLATVLIDRPKSWLERWIDSLDPDFPSAVVGGPGLAIDDRAEYGRETLKPQFVLDDDKYFLGRPK